MKIVQGQRSISADIAHRLAHYFGMSERHWLDLHRFTALAMTNLGGPFTSAKKALIAGTALASSAALVTRNVKEFSRIAGLEVVSWHD